MEIAPAGYKKNTLVYFNKLANIFKPLDRFF